MIPPPTAIRLSELRVAWADDDLVAQPPQVPLVPRCVRLLPRLEARVVDNRYGACCLRLPETACLSGLSRRLLAGRHDWQCTGFATGLSRRNVRGDQNEAEEHTSVDRFLSRKHS